MKWQINVMLGEAEAKISWLSAQSLAESTKRADPMEINVLLFTSAVF